MRAAFPILTAKSKFLLTSILLTISISLFAQKPEHYTDNGCDCFIYFSGPDTTKTYTPTHAQIDTAEAAIRARLDMKHPPNNLYGIINVGLENYERHYHGTISQKGHKELRIHGVNKSNPNEVWVTYYDLNTGKLYNFIVYGAGG